MQIACCIFIKGDFQAFRVARRLRTIGQYRMGKLLLHPAPVARLVAIEGCDMMRETVEAAMVMMMIKHRPPRGPRRVHHRRLVGLDVGVGDGEVPGNVKEDADGGESCCCASTPGAGDNGESSVAADDDDDDDDDDAGDGVGVDTDGRAAGAQ